jgi:exonuclease SbcC
MRILSIEIENIKSYEFARVAFTEGVNAIVGHNGAGKSTLLEAVGFALFSSIDYGHSAFLREGTRHGSVTVTFESEVDDCIYEVVRRIGGAGVKHFVIDPAMQVAIAEGGPDVERFLCIHMGLLPNTDLARVFKDAVGVPQGTLTAAFQLSPSNRKAVFDGLLQVEEYKNAFDKLLQPLNLLDERRNQEAQVIARLEGMLAALPGLEARAVANAEECAATETALTAARASLAQVQATVDTLDAKRTALLAAEKVLEQARSALSGGQANHEVAAQRLQEAIAAQSIVAMHLAGHDLYLDAQQKKAQLDAQQQKRHDIDLERSRVASTRVAADQRAQQATDELARIAQAEARIVALAAAAELEAELEERRAAAQAQQGELRGAQALLKQVEQSLTQEQKKLESMQAAMQTRPAAEAELAAIDSLLQDITLKRDALNEERNAKLAEGLACKAQNEKLMEVHGATCPVCARELTPAHRAELLAGNKREMDVLREALTEANRKVSALQEEIDQLAANRQRVVGALHNLPADVAVAEQETHVAQLRVQRDGSQARVAELATAPEVLRAVEAELDQLGKPQQQIAIARATADKRAAVEAGLQSAAAESAKATAALDRLDQQLAPFAGLDAEVATVQQTIEAHLPAYQAVLANQQVAATLPRRTAAVDAAAAENQALEEALAAAEEAAAEAALHFDAASFAQAQSASARLHGEVGSLTSAASMLAKEAATLATQLVALRSEQAKLADATARLCVLDGEHRTLKRLREFIKQAGPYVTAHVIQQVSVSAAQIFGELTGDFARVLRWGEDYAIALEVDGRKRDFQSLSGGEQMVAALAVRLALLRTISGISVAFFDEPTANLDEPRREALAGQLVAFKGLKQLFVISHDDTFEYATNNTIHLARVDGVSRVLDGGMREFAGNGDVD